MVVIYLILFSNLFLFSLSHNVTVSKSSGGEEGIDVSTTCTSDSASCFTSSGYTFFIPRGYRSSGQVDTQVCDSLKAAKSGGIPKREVYLFPCPTCSKSASDQMSEMMTYINTNCASSFTGRVWLDIEGTQYWYSDYSSNKKFYESLVDACQSQASSCGIYSSTYQWSSIFGSTSYAYKADGLPIWYAHYDNKKTYDDFTPFGGWTYPHAKQYAGTNTVCNMGVDNSWSEGTF
jgi:hypothetical protein